MKVMKVDGEGYSFFFISSTSYVCVVSGDMFRSQLDELLCDFVNANALDIKWKTPKGWWYDSEMVSEVFEFNEPDDIPIMFPEYFI